MLFVNNNTSSSPVASLHYEASGASEAAQLIELSVDGLLPEIDLFIVSDTYNEMMEEINKQRHADDGAGSALDERAAVMSMAYRRPAARAEVAITMPETASGSAGADSAYAERQKSLENISDTVKKVGALVTSLASTGSNIASIHQPGVASITQPTVASINQIGVASIGWQAASLSQAVVLAGNLVTQCIHAYSGKELPQGADFVANLASLPVAKLMNLEQKDEKVIRACHLISLSTTAALTLLTTGSNIGMPGVAAASPKLIAAICAVATGVMNITADVAKYESDKMKRKTENQSGQTAAESPSVSINMEAPARRVSI